MKKLLALALVVISLGGCAAISDVTKINSSISSYTVNPQSVVIASNTFDALEVTATNYLRLKKCSSLSSYICRNQTATALLIPAIRSGRVARNNLQEFLKSHPDQLGPQGGYDALQASISTIRAVFDQYRIGA